MFFEHTSRREIENTFAMPWCWSHFLEETDQCPKGPDLFPQISSLSRPICWPHNTWQLVCIIPLQFTRLVALNLMDWKYLEAFYRVLFTISHSCPSYFQYQCTFMPSAAFSSRCVSQLLSAATMGGAFGASGGHWPDRCCDLVWSWPPPGHACWMGAPQVVGLSWKNGSSFDLSKVTRIFSGVFFHFASPVEHPARCCSWVSSVPFCSPFLSPWRWS